MDLVGYYAAVLLAKVLRALPLRAVAALGRFGGAVAYWIDARHRRVAMLNLSRCYPSRGKAELRTLLKEHFRRLGENYASAVKTSGMPLADLAPHLEILGAEKLATDARGAIIAVGHFGNFEVYARMDKAFGRLRRATTYRALKQPRLDELVRQLRAESGCLFFDRRRDSGALRNALGEGGIVLGLLCDQHAGSGGLRLPFFGHECSVTAAPALLAQRYSLPLHTAICYRVGLARWRIEIGEEIATRTVEGRRRSAEEVMMDVHAVFECAINRDPANWLWVHDRWRFSKDRKMNRAARQPVPA